MSSNVILSGTGPPPLMSWPAEKCFPLARSTITATSGSSAARVHAASSSSSSSGFWALAASGRLSEMVAILPPNEPAVVEHQPLPAACPVRDVATGPGPFQRVGLRRQVFIQKRDEVR